MNDTTTGPGPGPGTDSPYVGGIWSAILSPDAPAMIRFVVDVLGFDERLVVPGEDPGVVVHSELAWPEGGVVQVATADRANSVFSQIPVGVGNLYVVTADPAAVHRRCVDAGVEIVRDLEAPEHDPTGSGFSVRDHEGNLWSFGTYAG